MYSDPILIVDDQPHNLATIRQALESEYRLVFATNGEMAIDAAKRLSPRLILLDIQMPGMDGYKVCQQLKYDDRTADIPIIFVTSMNDEFDEELGFEYGAVDFINKPFSPNILKARVRAHLSLVNTARLERSYEEAIRMLALAGHHNDEDTGVHIWRMAEYAGCIARASGWTEEEVKLLELAAPMHDTGKIGIPETILRKPGKLTADEWIVMQHHPRIGYDILIQSDAKIFKLAAEVSLRHHEKWNGEGYPDGLKGYEIPESARIVAVADVFDALTMKRPYKDPWPVDEAMAFINENSGSHFDPQLVSLMQGILPKLLKIKQKWDAVEAQQMED